MDASSKTPDRFPNRCPVCEKYIVIELSQPDDGGSFSRCGHLASSIDGDGRETLAVKLESGQPNVDVLSANHLRAEAIGRVCEHIPRTDGPPRLALDLAGVDFVSSSVVGQLITLHKAVQARSGWLKLRNVGPETREALQVMGLDKFFEIIDP
ncbi:MAG: STAS domain-containing protein [Planctomycetota bacterium]